jgi:type I restriction enzyme S subunit
MRQYVSTGNIDTTFIVSSESVTYDERPSRADLNVKEGDVLFARMQATDKVVLVTNEIQQFLWSTGFVAFRPKSVISSKWLQYWLRSKPFMARKDALCTGATQKAITNEGIRELTIPLPPISEQKRLVKILDEVDVLYQLRVQADQKTTSTIPATFFSLFGDPTSNTNDLPSVQLGNIAKLERGKFTPRPRNDPSYFDGEYPFIQTGDISESGGLLSTWKQTLNERGKAVSKEFPTGTIVMAIVGATIGATAILQIPVYCTDSIIGIRVNQKLCLIEYIEFVLRARRPLLLAQAPDSARSNLNLEILREIPVPLPSLELQKSFVDHVHKIQALQAKQAVSRQRIKDLFQSLLHRAFQGEL